MLDQGGLSGDDVVAWLHENYPIFASHLPGFEWISERLSFSDAHLVGGMNWRLGLTPAADRNSDNQQANSKAAGQHYAAMHVARAIALSSASLDDTSRSSTSRGFRPLKAPQSKQNEWRAKDVQAAVKKNANSVQDQFSASRLQATIVGGWMEMILDRLPMENKINPTDLPYQGINVNSCVFLASPWVFPKDW